MGTEKKSENSRCGREIPEVALVAQ